MKGASIACQSAGRPGLGGSGRFGVARVASEYIVASAPDGLPVVASMRRILIPLQKLPKLSHGCPSLSKTIFGSMALKSPPWVDLRTSPSSCQWYLGLCGSSVSLVANAMPELFEPKVEYA